MKTVTMTDKQVKIVEQLLDWHIENLIDEPDDSPRGEECQEAKALFDKLYNAPKQQPLHEQTGRREAFAKRALESQPNRPIKTDI